MKRFSKILAVLLSVCVIAGLIAVFASAEDAADFREVSENFDTLTDAGTNAPLDTWTTDSTGAASADLGAAQVTVGSEESPENKYVKLYATLGTTMPVHDKDARNKTHFVSYMINGKGVEQKINNHRYTVIQFLFTAEGGKYVDGSYIQPTTTNGNDLGSVKITLNDGKYYAVAGANTTTGSSVELNPDGDWNVVTYVLDMDSFTEAGGATIGDKSKTNSYIYVNGQYCARRWLSTAVDFGYFASLKIGRYSSTSVAAGDNIIVDGVNVRSYLNNLGANGETTYTTAAGVYGVPTFLSDSPLAKTADAFKMQDVKYSNYSTTADYPKLSENYVRSGVVAYIGDLGYFTVDAALAAVKDGETLKLYVDREISSDDVAVTNFFVEAYNGAKITFAPVYLTTEETIDGGVRYTVTKIKPAYIGDKGYDSAAEAFAALQKGETIKLEISANVPLLSLDNFVVEVAEGANVVFDSAYPKNRYQITKRSSTVYEVKKAVVDYIEVVDDFDSITMLDTNGTAETIEVKDGETVINKYQQLTVTAGKSSGFTFDYEGVVLPRMSDNLYTVHQFLFSAEGGAYVDGTFIKPTNVSPELNVLGIKIVKGDDGKYYAVHAEKQATAIDLTNTSTRKTELNSNGDWNVVTIVSAKYRATYAIGDANVGHYSYVYVNGTFLGEKSQSANNHIAISKLTVTAPAGSAATLLFDDFIGRFYLTEMGEDNLGRYSTPTTYGVDDFYSYRYSTDLVKLEDVKYNKYNTPLDYPAMLVDGQAKYPSGVAEVNGIGYFNMADALAALKDEESTIKLFEGTKIEGIYLDKFYVEDYSGAVTFDTNYKTTAETIDGGIRYTVTKLAPAYIGDTKYDTVEDALGALKDGGTVKIYLDATITGAAVDNFIVEVYEGAKVVFDPVFLRTHKITKRSNTVFEVVKTDYVELVDNFDSSVMTSGSGWTETSVTAGDNKYQKFATNLTNTATLKLFGGETDIPKMTGHKYVAVQFLLGAEGDEYINNLYIHPVSPTGKPSDVRGLKIVKDGDVYKIGYSEKGADPGTNTRTELRTNGDWNVVTIIYWPDYTTKDGAPIGVKFYYYVNGKYVGGSNQGSVVADGYMTQLQLSTSTGATNSATSNIIIDDYSMRYFSGANANFASVVNGASTAKVNDFAELKYNKYLTSLDYPAMLVGGQVKYPSGLAEVDGVGYFDLTKALAAITDNGTIKFNKDANVTGVTAKNFTIVKADGVTVTFGDDVINAYDITEVANGYELALSGKYNIKFVFGDNEVATDEMKTSSAPNASAQDWSAYIFGDATNVTWEFSVDGGETFNTLEGAWTKVADGITVIVRPADESVLEVKWYNKDGENVDYVDYYFPGAKLAVKHSPSADLERVNDWYGIGYAWENIPTEAITADVNIAQKQTIVNALKWRFNYRLGLRFYPTFYIPVPGENDGVTLPVATEGVNKDRVLTYVGNVDLDMGGKYYQDVNGKLTDLFQIDEWKKGGDLSAYKWADTEGKLFAEMEGAAADSGIGLGVGKLNLRPLGMSEDGQYYTYNTDIQPAQLNTIRALQICYTVEYDLDGDGTKETYYLTAPCMVSLATDAPDYAQVADYSEIVLNSSCDKGSKLVAEYLLFYKEVNPGAKDLVDSVLASHKDKFGETCKCLDGTADESLPDDDGSFNFDDKDEEDALTKDDVLIGFRTDSNAAGFEVYIPTTFINSMTTPSTSTSEDGKTKTVVTYEFAVASKSNGLYNPDQYYKFNENVVAGEYTKFRPKNSNKDFQLYDFACATTFKVYVVATTSTYEFDEETQEFKTKAATTAVEEIVFAEFTYSLAQYVADYANAPAATTDDTKILNAYLSFAKAAYDYKDLRDGDAE